MAKQKKADPDRIPVTMRSVMQRINRKLRESGEILKTARGAQARGMIGDYYIISSRNGNIMRHHVNPEELGRKLGVLQNYEEVL
jgi:hypothetical protein